MGRAQSDTYSSLFTKSDNVNLDETFDRKSVFVHVLSYMNHNLPGGMGARRGGARGGTCPPWKLKNMAPPRII